MPIHVLPTSLVNKIAAGEVIERPSSVVKELLENAVDAGASRIELAVEQGGRRLISVSDNGRGMSADDLALAFAPHATSKISAADDLFNITTMGFRGEALASIAAVSNAHIRSRLSDAGKADANGHEISASGDDVGEVRPCPAPGGTTVSIRELFFNVPARRKFLRTVQTEFGHVSEQLARIALARPQVAFRLTHNGRQVQNLPPADATRQRVADLFGAELADALLTITPRNGAAGIAGLICRPHAVRPTSNWQYFFLNGRYVRDRMLAHALREAYRGLAEPNRYPVAFVFLTVDPAEVDVNVHPTKIEVRFHNSQGVHQELLAALRETLNRADLEPAVSLGAAPLAASRGPATREEARAASPSISPEQAADALQDRPPSAADEDRRASLRQALADFFTSSPKPQPRFEFTGTVPRRDAPPREPASPAMSAESNAAGAPRAAVPLPQAVQLHNTYIVTADDDGVLIIDQHALHERILYNELSDRLTGAGLEGQRMLIPPTITLSAAAIAALAEHAELLDRLGIETAAFGPAAVAVQRFPSLLASRGVAPEAFIRDLAETLAEGGAADDEALLEELMAMMACKAAVKAGDSLSAEEIASLLARRNDTEKASACPHGRPTTIRLSLRELEKQFHRT